MMVTVVAHGDFSVSPLFNLYLIFFSSLLCFFSAVFGWFESVVIGFKVVGCFSCFSGGDRV